MPPVDMSAKAVTARLRLASDLRDLCLLLGTAKIESKPAAKRQPVKKRQPNRRKSSK